MFLDKLSKKLLWLLCLFFPDEIAFSSILRIKMICFGRHSKSQLVSNFKLSRTTTIYGDHGRMADIP